MHSLFQDFFLFEKLCINRTILRQVNFKLLNLCCILLNIIDYSLQLSQFILWRSKSLSDWTHSTHVLLPKASGGSRGGANPAMAPHRNWQWSLPPFGTERAMVVL